MIADFFANVEGLPTANDLIFAVFVVVGAFFHYLKKVIKKETKVSMGQWFGPTNLPGTLMSFGGLGLAIVAALATDITSGLSFYALLYTGLTTGFTIDSGLNSDGTAKTPVTPVEAVTLVKKSTSKKSTKESK